MLLNKLKYEIGQAWLRKTATNEIFKEINLKRKSITLEREQWN